MGVTTLALSAFSIIPMAISFVHREFLSQVVTHMRREFKDDEANPGGNKIQRRALVLILRSLDLIRYLLVQNSDLRS